MTKPKAFSRIGRRFLILPQGRVAYVHPTKGLRNRRLTPQLIITLSTAANA